MNKRIKSTYLIKLKTLITFFAIICHICSFATFAQNRISVTCLGSIDHAEHVISVRGWNSFFSTLHYNIKHYITLHYNIKHYITLQYRTLHFITLRYITSNYVTFRHIMLHYITSNNVTLSYITLHYITLHYIDQAERVIIVRGWTSFCLKITLLPDVDFQQQTLLPVV